MIDIKGEYEKALTGRKAWLLLKEKYSITIDSGVIVFPSDDTLLNRESIKLLPVYRERLCLQKIFAISDREQAMNLLKGFLGEEIYSIKIEPEEMEALLKYYCLVPRFWANMAVVSLEEPFGNKYLLEQREVDIKDFIVSSIFRIR